MQLLDRSADSSSSSISRLFSRAVFASLVFASVAILAPAQDLVLTPSLDNTLYESASGATSNGSGPHLYVGNTAGGNARRALLEFDLSGVAPGTPVSSAELTLSLNLEPGGEGPTAITAHALNSAWGEGASDAGIPGGTGAASAPGDATWLHTFFNTATWTTPGGDFNAVPSANTTVDNPGTYTWTGSVLSSDVQSWIDDPGSNNGLILVGDETTTRNARRFDSREGASPATLALTFGAVPEPATIGLFGFGTLLLLSLNAKRRRRARQRDGIDV